MPRGRQGRGVGSGPSDRQADLAHPGTKGSNIRRRERLSAAPAPEPANYGASYENSSGRESILSRYCYSLLRLAVNASDLPQRSSNPCTWFRITPIFRFHCTRARVSRRPPLFRPGNIAVLPLAGLPAIRQPLRIPVIALASAGRARPFMGWLRCSWKCRSNASPHGPPILRRRFHHHFTDLLMLQPSRQSRDLFPGRAEFPLLVLRLPVLLPANHYRQHLPMHIHASHATIYCSICPPGDRAAEDRYRYGWLSGRLSLPQEQIDPIRPAVRIMLPAVALHQQLPR